MLVCFSCSINNCAIYKTDTCSRSLTIEKIWNIFEQLVITIPEGENTTAIKNYFFLKSNRDLHVNKISNHKIFLEKNTLEFVTLNFFLCRNPDNLELDPCHDL